MSPYQATPSLLHPDRLLPAEPSVRSLARELYQAVAEAPLVSPHGHCEAHWFADNTPFPNPTDLLVTPDHYVLRMLMSQGVSYDALGVPRADGTRAELSPLAAWQVFADHYHLFRGTPSRFWLDHALHEVLQVPMALGPQTAGDVYDHIATQLSSDAYRPRALFERFNLEILATTDAATDSLDHHHALRNQGLASIIPTFRPDTLTNPLHPQFAASMEQLAAQTGEHVSSWRGYLAALAARRIFFKSMGATASDHGVVKPATLDLPEVECQALLEAALAGKISAAGAARFEAQMLFEMARMSVDDGLVMQIHAGPRRNFAPGVFQQYGPDKGFDLPGPTLWLDNLKPMLDAFGFEPNFAVILYTVDETTYTRELAPLAGAFPSVTVGAPWWFFDSVEGMRRYRRAVTETAGFYNTAGFVDDTRAFLSIPARHDMYRRVEAGTVAALVAEHALSMDEAFEVMDALATGLARRAYKLSAS
jgi:glucuronate isomerase